MSTTKVTYRIEVSETGDDWRLYGCWCGLQKCRAEGAFAILSGMYDDQHYRLIDSTGSLIEKSHHTRPSVHDKAHEQVTVGRVWTEEQVKEMINDIQYILHHRYRPMVKIIVAKHGITLP